MLVFCSFDGALARVKIRGKHKIGIGAALTTKCAIMLKRFSHALDFDDDGNDFGGMSERAHVGDGTRRAHGVTELYRTRFTVTPQMLSSSRHARVDIKLVCSRIICVVDVAPSSKYIDTSTDTFQT